MSHRKYFGTDGIRGKVGEMPITPDFVLKLGWAAGKVLAGHGSKKIIIGKDTRISGYMLESALEAGLAAAGLSAAFTGPMPTPAVAYLTRTFRAEAGIVISASHNPFEDNGIKFFSTDGTKLSDALEEAIEAEIEKPINCVKSTQLGRASRIVDAAGRYIEFCKSTFPGEISLNGLKIVVDCANGATYHIAPNVLRELGANVITIGCQPDGMNINKNCGATDVRLLQQHVLAEKADIGLAFDGDGDRVIMVNSLGDKVDGDQILYIIAHEGQRQGQLCDGGVVGTLMSNMGLELALQQLAIPFVRTNVGDRYVLEELQQKNWRFGAENSGHVILLDKTTTGDGIIASLQVLSAMVRNQMNLLELCRGITLLPQTLINVNFNGEKDPLQNVGVKKIIADTEKELRGRGRILLRKSGTERLIRVMVEGESECEVNVLAQRIADVVQKI